MKMILEKENFLISAIRDILAVNPMVSVRRMQELVKNETGHSISDKYLSKLMDKVRRRSIIQSDRKRMNERLAEVRERYRVLKEDLSRSMYWRPEYYQTYGIARPNFKERLAVIKLIAQLESALFRTELLAGIFEHQREISEHMQPTEIETKVVGIYRSIKLEKAQ